MLLKFKVNVKKYKKLFLAIHMLLCLAAGNSNFSNTFFVSNFSSAISRLNKSLRRCHVNLFEDA